MREGRCVGIPPRDGVDDVSNVRSQVASKLRNKGLMNRSGVGGAGARVSSIEEFHVRESLWIHVGVSKGIKRMMKRTHTRVRCLARPGGCLAPWKGDGAAVVTDKDRLDKINSNVDPYLLPLSLLHVPRLVSWVEDCKRTC